MRSMRCAKCGRCCVETEMILTSEDVERISKLGYDPAQFVRVDEVGFKRLVNVGGVCFFYDPKRSRCRIYKHRPLGCRIYPVVYEVGVGPIIDPLCPMGHTVGEREFRRKSKALMRLLAVISQEAGFGEAT